MRVAVLTVGSGSTAALCLPALACAPGIEIPFVLRGQRQFASIQRKYGRQWKKIRKIGLLGALNGIRMRKWYGTGGGDLDTTCAELGIPIIPVDRINTCAAAEALRSADLDLGLSLGNGYIAERIFGIPREGLINLHFERLPEYQNAQSIIWPIYNNETETGITFHRIDRNIDTGAILKRRAFPITFRPSLMDTVVTTRHNGQDYIPGDLVELIQKYDSYAALAEPQIGGTSYTTPTIRQYLRMVRNNQRLYRAAQQNAKSKIS